MVGIIVTFQLPGLHRYPKAAASHHYLASTHRHMFHIRAEMQVFHEDREVEFIAVKEKLQAYTESLLNGTALAAEPELEPELEPEQVYAFKIGTYSCEMIAEVLATKLQAWYPHPSSGRNRWVIVEVTEDGENGAFVGRSGNRIGGKLSE